MITRIPEKVQNWSGSRYLLAFASVGVAFAIKWGLNLYLEEECPYLVFFTAVALTATYSGRGPALISVASAADQ